MNKPRYRMTRAEDIRAGDIVLHRKFGASAVCDVEPVPRARVTVRFRFFAFTCIRGHQYLVLQP